MTVKLSLRHGSTSKYMYMQFQSRLAFALPNQSLLRVTGNAILQTFMFRQPSQGTAAPIYAHTLTP
jgi:hypothetical protein